MEIDIIHQVTYVVYTSLPFHFPVHFQSDYFHIFQAVIIYHFHGDIVQSGFEFGGLSAFLVNHHAGFETVFGIVGKVSVRRNCKFRFCSAFIF
jgi:hypothetical protein